MRTLHWADWGIPEPRAPLARPVRHVRTLDHLLPQGHPRRYCTSPPALAAIVRTDDQAAEVAFLPTPGADGAT
jgi:hypothetical protein